jgi:tetratricopeptide (TPR) repeat protein
MKRLFVCLSMAFGHIAFSQDDTVKVALNLSPEEQAQQDYNSGLAALNSGNYLNAVDLFSKSLSLKPEFDKALYNRSIAYSNLKNYTAAAKDINSVLKVNPSNAEAYFAKGVLFYSQNMSDSSHAAFDKCISITKHAEAHYYKGLLFYKAGDFDESIKAHTSAIEVKHDYAYAYNDRASAKRAKNDYQGAIDDYEKALSFNKNLTFIYNNLGSAYRLAKNYPKAIEYYTKAIEQKGDYMIALNNRGATKLESGKPDDAKKDFELVLSKDPKNSGAYNNLSSVAIKQQDYKKAKDLATKAIQLNENNGPAYYNRGIARQMLREEDGSCEDWKKALELGVSSAQTFLNTDCK